MRELAKRLLSAVIALCTAVTLFSASAAQVEDFTDLPSQPWYYDYLYRATDLGLFSGTSSTTFSPEREITRGETVMVLSRVHERLTGEKAVANSAASFKDVSPRSYYSKAVNWAAENKIVSGYGNRTFGPNNTITHAELAVIFHNYLRLVDKDSLYPTEKKYLDQEKIPSWAQYHVQMISGYNIFQGSEFAPQAKTVRSEAAALFVRMYEKAAYPLDTETQRQKYVYVVYTDDKEDHPVFQPLGEEHKKVIASYSEYTELLSTLYNSIEFKEIEQVSPLVVSEESFSDNVLLAIEVQREGMPAFDCEFGGITLDANTAKITLIETGIGGSTADKKGIIFFVLVPKTTSTVEVVRHSWTENTDWTPA